MDNTTFDWCLIIDEASLFTLFGTHEERRSISIVRDRKSRIWWGCKCRANWEEGEMQPKVYFTSVLFPGNEFKDKKLAKANCQFVGDALVVHQMAEQNVVSAAFVASPVSRCVPVFNK